MAGIYEIDQTNLVKSILPPDKRTPIHYTWLATLLSGMQRSNDILNYYQDGFTVPTYDVVDTYYIGDLVSGGYKFNNSVFESQTDSNVGNVLTDTTNWIKVSDSFIGVLERAKYYSSKISYEWALNKYFGTTFRQPTTIGAGVYGPLSDIYITNVPIVYGSMELFAKEPNSTIITTVGADGYVFDTEIFSTTATYGFVIHIPLAVFNTFGSDDAIRTNVVRQFADRYVCVGLEYSIETY